MKYLNLGCGGSRIHDIGWYNLDDLHSQLAEGTPERDNLNLEPRYINHDLREPMPFMSETFDAILASHLVEHFDTPGAVKLLQDCYRVLKPGGVLLVSVPDASYFRKVYPEDRNENWPRLFEVTDPNNTIPTFFEAALFFEQHLQVLTEDSLWCLLTRAGFVEVKTKVGEGLYSPDQGACRKYFFGLPEAGKAMEQHLNRLPFSLIMAGIK